jgi:hypothetical protein
MEKSPIVERFVPSRQPVIGRALRFSATGAGDVQSCLAGYGPAASSPCAQRSGECSPGGTGQALRLAGLASGQNLLAGAACLATWGLLWLLALSDFISPPGNGFAPGEYENPDAILLFHEEGLIAPIDHRNDADPQVIHDSSPLRPEGTCGSGMIELDGSCILGEEIEVSSPPGWRRRRAHVEAD